MENTKKGGTAGIDENESRPCKQECLWGRVFIMLISGKDRDIDEGNFEGWFQQGI